MAPLIGTAIAITDTVVLLSVIRLLLLLVDGGSSSEVEVLGVSGSIGFAPMALIAVGANVIAVGARFVEALFTSANLTTAVRTARRAVVESWFAADWEHVRSARMGRLQQLISVNAQQTATAVQLVSTASVSLTSLLVFATLVVLSEPLVALTFVVIGAGMAGVFAPLRRRIRRAADAHAKSVGALALEATSYAQLNRELHVYGVGEAAAQAMDRRNDRVARLFGRLRLLQRLTPSLYQQAMFGAVIVVVVIGRALDVNAAGFGTAAILAVRSLTYVQQLTTATQNFAESRPYLEEMAESITDQHSRRRHRGDRKLGPVHRIELRRASYEYEPGRPALHPVDLDLRAGEWLGVVGPSGGGKSTLVNLIAGLIVPSSGDYLLNGVASGEYDAASWAEQFGLLSQEPALLRATIAENIAFHRGATEDDVRRAARLAAIEGELDALTAGFATNVGDGHINLSGGQRQRVALARALLRSPSCLLLDEPSSALDAANERLVEESLANVPRDSIVIVVSHRPAMLARCHRFVALEGGRIVAAGDAADVGVDRYVGRSTGD